MIIAIDPGSQESGVVIMSEACAVKDASVMPNTELVNWLFFQDKASVVIEQISSYGMSVGESVFETVWWSGRFFEAAASNSKLSVHRLKRGDVKLHLCGSMRAKDANIRQALIDRYGGTEGKAKAIGTKKNPGPLYGVKSHCWAALALAITFADKEAK